MFKDVHRGWNTVSKPRSPGAGRSLISLGGSKTPGLQEDRNSGAVGGTPRAWGTALRMTLALALLTGLIYPAIVTGLAWLLFPKTAQGSLIEVDGKVVGSELIGQNFTRPEYFHGRPSAAGDGYDANNSGGSNLGPTSRKLVERVFADVMRFRKENPHYTGHLPADLFTASGSGLDPHISPGSAYAQVARVSRIRSVPEGELRKLIAALTEGRQFRILGDPRVNVLRLNLALDRSSRATP